MAANSEPSLHDFFAGPRPPKDDSVAARLGFAREVDTRKFPGQRIRRSLRLAYRAHVTLLFLPIWGFLPATAHDLAPVQIELTWYVPPRDLPPISLPRPYQSLRPNLVRKSCGQNRSRPAAPMPIIRDKRFFPFPCASRIRGRL